MRSTITFNRSYLYNRFLKFWEYSVFNIYNLQYGGEDESLYNEDNPILFQLSVG